ncbi:MAG: malto-oligosyltrehalose synthase [Chloroflexi bacterium]|nr:malto-oligosyltrehalose synthase [Chloroflexota bacterium]
MSYDFNLLVAETAHRIVNRQRIPRATYRMQFNRDFTFKDAEALVPYLDALGISDLYTSPILRATPGSTHGYDICDPRHLNPELGTPDDFARLSAALKAHGMGLIMDIVPNHMGIGTDCNQWWLDVLENGTASAYASFFDIDWNPIKPELKDRVLVPLLGEQYGTVLESGQFTLAFSDGAFHLRYADHVLPIALASYGSILDAPASYLLLQLGETNPHVQELLSILDALKLLPQAPEAPADRAARHQAIKQRLAALHDACAEFRHALDEALVKFNGTVGDPRSFDTLDALITAQSYRLAYWRVAAEEINYRRFFDINTMAAIRVELPEVFNATHQLIFELLLSGQVTGLRIDHPDGLWNPAAYFRQLQEQFVVRCIDAELEQPLSANERAELEHAVSFWFEQREDHEGRVAHPVYTVAEKILSEMEPLPLNWTVDGTTGYDFMSLVNNLFINSRDEAELTRIFSEFTGRSANFDQLEYASKKQTMSTALASEINALAHRLERLSEHDRHTRDFTLNGLLHVLREVIACLPIYRTYITRETPISQRDRQFIEQAVAEAKQRNPHLDATIFDHLQATLLLDNLEAYTDDQSRDVFDFVMRFQQISGPVMAKSIEDRLFYVYNRLVSVNEVGSSPAMFGISAQQFAEENMERCRLWPHTMLATSTHDTKRSEDVRARLNVLSELPLEWDAALDSWARINTNYKVMLNTGPAPSASDEYLLYQTLLGTFEGDLASYYIDRIVAYMSKATKEAKVFTSWTNANAAYDQAVENFVRAILNNDEFVAAFLPVYRRIAYFGRFNSLSQTLLKLTCPGMPDTYRGTEIWDFSLVDPDNRREVDYEHIWNLLTDIQEKLENRAALADDLLAHADDGRIKLYVTQTALQLRRDSPKLFTAAPYEAIPVEGAKAGCVCAFIRRYGDVIVLVIAPRLIALLTEGQQTPPIGAVWNDTVLKLDEYAGKTARSLFTDEAIPLDGSTPLASLLRRFPVGLFVIE